MGKITVPDWMKFLWGRLTTRPDGQPIGVPTHLFFFITLVFAIAFILPPSVFHLEFSELFGFSDDTGHWLPLAWGLWLMATSVINTFMLVTRSKAHGSTAAMMGFTAWLYAAWAYAAVGFWLGFWVGAVPNTIFWAWYYWRVKMWHRYLFDD